MTLAVQADHTASDVHVYRMRKNKQARFEDDSYSWRPPLGTAQALSWNTAISFTAGRMLKRLVRTLCSHDTDEIDSFIKDTSKSVRTEAMSVSTGKLIVSKVCLLLPLCTSRFVNAWRSAGARYL